MSHSRRQLLALLGLAGLTGIAGCKQQPASQTPTSGQDTTTRSSDPARTRSPNEGADSPIDHDHFGGRWRGGLASGDGLAVVNTAADGTGVRGYVAAESGETRGVVGQVDSPDGYGLFTPDDARVEGLLDVGTLGTSADTALSLLVDGTRALELTPEAEGAAGNLFAGHSSNSIALGVKGAAINGGGFDDGEDVEPNQIFDDFGTIGGGRANVAGLDNDDPASAEYATVGGGWENTASGFGAIVGGGLENQAIEWATTIGGGLENSAYAEGSTVSGGRYNNATSLEATVSGGDGNTASARQSTVGGGSNNTASGIGSTVAGGLNNTAEGDASFAAGNGARALHKGVFAWSGVESRNSASTGDDQFLISASGGVGIGTNAPVSQLHVRDNPSGFASLDNHVMTVENYSTQSSPDVLALKTFTQDPSGQANFITFLDIAGFVGAIEGDGQGGVSYKSGAGDIAEYFPKADPDGTFTPGDVVGLKDGSILADPTVANEALVISAAPMVTGNVPRDSDEEDMACVALLGQVPVRVGAPVAADELLVATAEGTAVTEADATGEGPVVGRALADAETSGDLVLTLVHAGVGHTPNRIQNAQDERLSSMETEIEQLQAGLDGKDDRIDALERENEQLRGQLTSLEKHLANIFPDESSSPIPAYD